MLKILECQTKLLQDLIIKKNHIVGTFLSNFYKISIQWASNQIWAVPNS